MNWLLHNKEWIFSGIGVFIIALIINWLNRPPKNKKVNQRQKSGDNSVNIQIGGDFNNKKK